jgi:poly-gamma-glutamate synthesis protein (capsule biosynthesis protein)
VPPFWTRRGFCAALASSLLPAQQRPIRLLAAGDVMLSRWIGKEALRLKDPAWPLREIAPFLSAADLTFINLESPFRKKGPYPEKGMVFRARPETIDGLVLAGVDVVSLANNHVRDAGAAGLEDTLALLAEKGIAAAGLEADCIVERAGMKFGFLAYTYDQKNGNWKDEDARIAGLDTAKCAAAIAALKPECDTVLVSMHAGVEYAEKPHPSQVGFARAAIEAGAAAVIGHHPHVVQPVEEYKEGVIFYSLGNFVFDQFQRKATQKGLVAELEFEGRRVARYRTHGIDIVRGQPKLAVAPPKPEG